MDEIKQAVYIPSLALRALRRPVGQSQVILPIPERSAHRRTVFRCERKPSEAVAFLGILCYNPKCAGFAQEGETGR